MDGGKRITADSWSRKGRRPWGIPNAREVNGLPAGAIFEHEGGVGGHAPGAVPGARVPPQGLLKNVVGLDLTLPPAKRDPLLRELQAHGYRVNQMAAGWRASGPESDLVFRAPGQGQARSLSFRLVAALPTRRQRRPWRWDRQRGRPGRSD